MFDRVPAPHREKKRFVDLKTTGQPEYLVFHVLFSEKKTSQGRKYRKNVFRSRGLAYW